MPVDYYFNKSVDELLVMLSAVQARGTVGVISMFTAAGSQQMKSWQGANSVPVEIRNILYSLHLRDPETYANPHKQRIRSAAADYRRARS